ncbi:MAG: DsbE family thiol:disulfide interchange protein [Gammaproteobacteria bacterium]|nr:DsbE family thiol:disulfide interchange protein [Gammaproteobacteria bacterium]
MAADKRTFAPLRMALWLPLVAFIGLCAVFFASLEFSPRAELPSPLIDRPLPTFSLPELHTASVRTTVDLPDGPFLLNVWATWCFPCREEHPVLMDIASEGFAIVGLNYKDDDPKAIEWLNNIGDPYRLNLVDRNGDFGIDLGVYGVPATYLIDSERTIRYKHIGPISSSHWREQLAPILRSLQRVDEQV